MVVHYCDEHGRYCEDDEWKNVDQRYRDLMFEKNGHNVDHYDSSCDKCIRRLKITINFGCLFWLIVFILLLIHIL